MTSCICQVDSWISQVSLSICACLNCRYHLDQLYPSAVSMLLLTERSLGFLIMLPMLQKLASCPRVQWHWTLAAGGVRLIRAGWSLLAHFKSVYSNCNTQSKGKQWRVEISEAYQNQWEFSILLMRHVFHHFLWKVLLLFSWGLKTLQRKQEVVTAT